MKLQDFPSLGVDYYGMRIVWRQGYHRQISGQSVHIADRERNGTLTPCLGVDGARMTMTQAT